MSVTVHATTRGAAFVGALVVLAGCASQPSAGSAARTHPAPAQTTPAVTSTRVTTWSPFTRNGALRSGLHVVERTGATCELVGGSHAPVATRADRCSLDDHLLDPCFAPHGRIDHHDPVVVCADAPWQRSVTRLHLKRLPPQPSASNYLGARPDASGTPWALQLTSGRRCVYSQGAGGGTRELRMNYVCDAQGPYESGPYLFGSVDRSRRLWRIQASRNRTGRHRYLLTIARAWR